MMPTLMHHVTENGVIPLLTSRTSGSTPSSSASICKILGATLPSSLSVPACSKTLDVNPLWVQSSSVSSTSSEHQSIFVPNSLIPLSSGLSLAAPHLQLGVAGDKASPAMSTALTSPIQNLAIPVRPSLMYQLMSSACGTRPLLAAPVLTVLPSASNLMTQQSLLFANSMTANNQHNIDVQSVIKSINQVQPQDQVTAELISGKTPVKLVMAEPATGQTIPVTFPHDFSPVGTPLSSPHPRTLASIPPSELTSQHMELKAFAEDFKTRRIRLGFTQGAVGQSLAEKGYNNFAQSTISRFEQMQLSPANAATIKVILEKWLLEAECPETASNTTDDTFPQMAGRKRKKRAVFAPQTKSILDEFFAQNPRPNRQAIENISNKLDLLPEEVRVWFCNKRQKSKPSPSLSSHRSSFDRESSLSTSSSGVPSPTMSDGGMSQKRRSPSPPKTPFTIEELSKSSISSSLVFSPVHLSSPSMPQLGMVASVTQSTNLPLLFNGINSRAPAAAPFAGTTTTTQLFNNPLMPQFVTPAQSTA